MGETTKIEWTHHTFNPWIGCTKVHAGCKHCYAEAQNKRWAYNGGRWGVGAPRKVTAAANWQKPLAWAQAAARDQVRRRVFCASLADVLDEEAPPEAQARLWNLICQTADLRHGADEGLREGGLDWLLLTKRPERWEIIPRDVRPYVWLGASISDQETADTFVPRLLEAQGFARRFLSAEPLVGPVDLTRLTLVRPQPPHGPGVYLNALTGHVAGPDDVLDARIDWVIIGGESGPGARTFDTEWARSLIAQCRAAGVAPFLKQLGAEPIIPDGCDDCDACFAGQKCSLAGPVGLRLRDRKGGDMSEWDADLRVREFPRVAP